MSPKRTLESYMSCKPQTPVDTYKCFQDSVTQNNVAASLKEAFDYCQATFNLTPLGNQAAKRDVGDVKDKSKRGKVL